MPFVSSALIADACLTVLLVVAWTAVERKTAAAAGHPDADRREVGARRRALAVVPLSYLACALGWIAPATVGWLCLAAGSYYSGGRIDRWLADADHPNAHEIACSD